MAVSFRNLLIGFVVAAFMLYFPSWWCRRRRESEESYGLRWFMGPGAWKETIAMTLLTLIPLTFVSLRWPSEWGGPGPFHPSFWRALDLMGGGLAAAFIEETFYRGWLQTLAVRRWGPWVAIPLVSLLFALSHLFVSQRLLRVATFFPGLVMGALRYRHRSVLPSIFYHALCNLWAVWWSPI
ncbi:MAG: CPBP family intramembrane metalloprotease [Synergistaceae bacterium]|jgi:membrane protease YdiL (CAAX protease family)|nr:CPBP family intramembrane metalloprotease [Synergistaceae bacterium]